MFAVEQSRAELARTVAQQSADLTREHRAKLAVREVGKTTDRDDARGCEPFLGTRADARQDAGRERREEARLATGRDDGDAAGLATVGRDLAHDLRRRHAEGAGERRRAAHSDLHRLRDPPRLRKGPDHRFEVEVALVEARALQAGNDLRDRRPHGLRVLTVERMSWAEEDDLGAAPERLRGAHRGADPEAARDVVRGRDDTAPARVAADDERPRAKGRILELLDRREEGVEIEVREDRHGSAKATVRR